MTYSAEPGHVESFRDATDNHKKMLGACRTPKKTKCVSCQEWRTTETGKTTASGFVCHRCHSPRTVV